MPNLYAYASFHVEHVDKEYAAEAEFQEPEGQYEAADPEQELEVDFTDSFSQQGKPRCMLNHYRLQLSLKIITIPMHLSL